MTAVRLIQPIGRETQPFEDIVDELKFFADMADDLGMPGDDHIYLRSIAEIRRLRALVPAAETVQGRIVGAGAGINFDLAWVDVNQPDVQIVAGINARLGMTWRRLDDVPEGHVRPFTTVVAWVGNGSSDDTAMLLGICNCNSHSEFILESNGDALQERPGERLYWLDEDALLATLPAVQS